MTEYDKWANKYDDGVQHFDTNGNLMDADKEWRGNWRPGYARLIMIRKRMREYLGKKGLIKKEIEARIDSHYAKKTERRRG